MRTLAFAVLIAGAAAADDWPHWRGPARDGISREAGWLDTWPAAGPRIAWTAEVGIGFSSFTIAQGRVFTMGHGGRKDTVFCLEESTGKVLWSHAYPAELGAKYFEGGTTGTPTVDGDRVYTLSRWGDTFCFEAATGKVVWSKDVQEETGAPIPDWGFSGSPLVVGDLLVLNVGAAGLALAKSNGRLVWKSEPEESGYSTPFPLRRGDATLVLLTSGKFYLAVDAKTGRTAWRVRWLTEYGVNSADPIVDGDRVFISSGYNKGAALLQLGEGEPKVLWQNRTMRSQMNAGVLLGGHLYGVDGNTTERTPLKCLDLATGNEKWSQPDFASGALTAADGKLIVLTGKGELLVAPASPEGFKPTARAPVVTGKCWTAPVLANGRIYVRNAEGRVVCVDVRKS